MKTKFKRYLYLSIIVLVALSLIIPSPAQAQQEPVIVHETQVGLGKEQAFKDETFYVRASATVTLTQDTNFNNVASAEIKIIATHQETGSSYTLTQTTASVGPFIGLKKGATFTYTLLNTPVKFPSAATVGQYNISAELVKVEPEAIWNLVKDRISDLSLDLGTIKYLGVSTPEIKLNLSAPEQVSAGESFLVELGVNAPSIEEVKVSLYTQKGTEDWSLEKELTSAAVASLSQEITAPIYGGELKIIAQATGFSIMGVTSTLAKSIVVSTTTTVVLPHPTIEISVDNPVALGREITTAIIVDNPSASIEKLAIELQPSWTKKPIVLTVSLNQDINTFDEAVAPLPSTGEYSLIARASRYLIGGKWVALSPPLEASALITTEQAPSVRLALTPGAVFPGVETSVEIKAVNPTSGDITIPYQVYIGTVADSAEEALELKGRSLWREGRVSVTAGIGAAEVLDYVFADISALEARTTKYLGFEVVVEKYSAAGTTIELEPSLVSSAHLTLKGITPPVIKMTPSAPIVDAGQPLTLNLELKNTMGVAIDFTLELWQRILTGEGKESLVTEKEISLGSSSMEKISIEVTAPDEPVEVRYEARISEIELAGVGSLSVETAGWAKVRAKLLVLPEIDLLLNPNLVPLNSSLEVRLTATNPSAETMTIPFSLYLKLPGKTRELWKQEKLALAAGESGSISKHLLIPQEWQNLSNVDIIVEIESFSLGERSVGLEPPLRIKKSFSIINLQLRAALTTQLEPSLLGLAYDSQSGYLIADKVGLNGTIGINNISGWENSPDIALHLEVTQSQGVQMVTAWKTIDIQTRELYGKQLTTEAKFTISNPTAEVLRQTAFSVQVNAEGGIQNTFSLGISRIEGTGWYLDSQARLIDKTSGGPFTGSISGAQLPEEYQGRLTQEKVGMVQEILGEVDSLIIDIQAFHDRLESKATILPTASKAYERLTNRGSSLMAELEILRDRGLLPGAALGRIDELRRALQELAGLETLVQQDYGDSPTPKEVPMEKFQETLSRQDSVELAEDPDADGLTTATELQLGYDPNVWDSQKPGMSDGEYLANSMAPGENLDQNQQGFLNASASLYLLNSTGEGLEDEDTGEYEDLTGQARQQAQQNLRDAAWGFFKTLLGRG